MVCEEAVDAIKALDVAGAVSTINVESGWHTGSNDVPRVVARFETVEQAQAFHRALIQCGEAARCMEAMEQADSSR